MPSFIAITDAADVRIAAYRDIRERDLVGRQGHFIAEGEVVLRTLLQSSRHRPISLLIDERRKDALAPILAPLPDQVPIFLAGQGVLDAIAGFPLHRGILAHGESEPAVSGDNLLTSLPSRALVVALMGIANHDNLGGIFRNAAAFGANGVLIDSDCCDPLYRKAIRVSVGNTLTLPFARLRRADDLADMLLRHGFELLALTPSGSASLAELKRGERVAILLGAEGPGLPAAVLERTRTIRIPMASGVDSLNVATTSGIVLSALTDNR